MSDIAKADLIHSATRAAAGTLVAHTELRNSLECLFDEATRGNSTVKLLQGVEGYRDKMLASLEKLEQADAMQLGWSWQGFLACYDDYIEAIRQTKCELIHDDHRTISVANVDDIGHAICMR